MIHGYPFIRILRVKIRLDDPESGTLTPGSHVRSAGSNGTFGYDNVIREFGSSLREVSFSWVPEVEDVPPTPEGPSVIEFFHSRTNYVI